MTDPAPRHANAKSLQRHCKTRAFRNLRAARSYLKISRSANPSASQIEPLATRAKLRARRTFQRGVAQGSGFERARLKFRSNSPEIDIFAKLAPLYTKQITRLGGVIRVDSLF
jgi:hypothetical protein